MKKGFILLAIIAYAGVAVYSLTRMKNPELSAVKAQTLAGKVTQLTSFKLVTNNQEVLMKFYHEAFATDWQAMDGGYQGQVLNATVQLITTKAKKRMRRTTMELRAKDLDTQVSSILAAGGSIKAQLNAAGKSFVANDPDGNVIALTQAAQ